MDKPRSSMSPAVQPQLAALGHAPHITTYKAVGKTQPPQPTGALSSPDPLILQTENPLASRQTPQFHKVPNLNNNNINNHQSHIYQQQHLQSQQVPFPEASTSAGTTLSSQPMGGQQSVTAKAFNSAQAVFNQSVPLSQSTGSAHQSRAVPPSTLRAASDSAPFPSSMATRQQSWSNGGEESRGAVRQSELASIKNIKRLSGVPQQEDTDRCSTFFAIQRS